MAAQFILASGSPRRRELLDQMGLKYTVKKADIAERAQAGEPPAEFVCRIAAEKGRWVAARTASKLPVLAADTVVVLEGRILGKPGHPAAAREMLLSLSARTHEVYSAVVLLQPGGTEHHRISVSRVTFAALDTDWIDAYCACGEPLDKAGAYAIQGYAAQFVSRLEGSFSGVMGLPLHEAMALLRKAGICAIPAVNLK